MRLTLLLAALVCTPPVAARQSVPEARIERRDPSLGKLIAPDAQVERIATGFGFTEGPLWQGGKLWFSDVVGDKLRTVDRAGHVTVVLDRAGGLADPPAGKSIGPNGLVPAPDGAILAAQMGARRVVKIDRGGRVTPLLDRLDGKRLNSPNDMVYGPDGALWITDPSYGLTNGMDRDPAKELPFNGVLRYADGRLTAAITDLKMPNGIGLSPRGDTLYVTDYDRATIFAYAVARGGRLGARRTVFTFPDEPNGGADGLKVDRLGNLWVTGPGGIWIMTPAGRQLGRIRLPEVAANIAFAEGGNAAWITASTSVYRVPIKGVGMLPRFAR